MTIELRPFETRDLPAVVELNNAAYPAVPVSSAPELAELAALAEPALVAEEDDRIVGFLFAIAPGSSYTSENYLYFAKRAARTGASSLYIDRIVIASDARGSGLGRRFYDAVFARARATERAEVTCEVNIEPPNPSSLAFHARLGFERVGEQSTKGGAFVVALLAAPVERNEQVGVDL